MSLARRVLEKRRHHEARAANPPTTQGHLGGQPNVGKMRIATDLENVPTNENQRWGTAGHRASEAAAKVHRKHMQQGRSSENARIRRRDKGSRDSSYEPSEVKG